MSKNKKYKENMNTIENKKVHPFLFLILLFILCACIFYAWSDWEKRRLAQQLKEVTQSEEIAQLLTGKEFSKKEFSENLENIKKAHMPEQPIKQNDLKELITSFAKIPNYNEESIGLAMKKINISQGENGLQTWQLTANWATMREETNIVQFNNPQMWHRMQEKDKVSTPDTPKLLKDDKEKITITATQGIIYDNNQKVLLQHSVLATQLSNYIKGDILSYDSTKQIAVFPKKAYFSGEAIKGSASIMSWNLNENKMYGTGKVEVIWTPENNNKK